MAANTLHTAPYIDAFCTHVHGRKVKYVAVRPRAAMSGAVCRHALHRCRTLQMLKLYATGCTGVSTASSWKPRSLAVAWMDGRSPDTRPGGVDGAVVCCSPSLPYYSHLPLSPCCVCIQEWALCGGSGGSLLYTPVNKFVLGGIEQVHVIPIN